MLKLVLKWIHLVSSQMWLLVAGVFGAFLIVVREKKITKQKVENKQLEQELEKAERIQNVEINRDRDAALERLRKHGNVRKD